jgi:hypothetical protein
MELILQFFEQDPRLWAQFKAGAAGKKGMTIADDIALFMKQRRAQYAREASKIKTHIDDFYRDTFEPVLEIATDTGVGEGAEVAFKGEMIKLGVLEGAYERRRQSSDGRHVRGVVPSCEVCAHNYTCKQPRDQITVDPATRHSHYLAPASMTRPARRPNIGRTSTDYPTGDPRAPQRCLGNRTSRGT